MDFANLRNQAGKLQLPWYQDEKEDSDGTYWSFELDYDDDDDDDKSLLFSQELRNAHFPNTLYPSKIPMNELNSDLAKYLHNYKTHMSLR